MGAHQLGRRYRGTRLLGAARIVFPRVPAPLPGGQEQHFPVKNVTQALLIVLTSGRAAANELILQIIEELSKHDSQNIHCSLILTSAIGFLLSLIPPGRAANLPRCIL